MDQSLYATAAPLKLPEPQPAGAPAASGEVAELLRQVVELHREQLQVLRAQVMAQDQSAKWRQFLARWHGEFPTVGASCRQILPSIERAYLALVQDLADHVRADGIDTEFALAEFLDRYGVRVAQLGGVLAQVGPLADAAEKM